jgi:N-acyl-D-amino-acid deacylase
MKRKEFLGYAAAMSAAAYGCEAGEQATSDTYDLVLKNGRVLDGGGTPWFMADIGVNSGRITKIGRVDEEKADRVIDVDGLFVSPGFIDVHAHSDTSMFDDPWGAYARPLRQGITTEINGNCGGSPVPPGRRRGGSEEGNNWSTFGEYFNQLEESGIGLNMATLIGHGTVRRYVMEENHGAPTQVQLDEMKGLVREAMQDGAVGLSTGLAYNPGVFAHTDEVVELAKVSAEYGGIYATHMRDFSSPVLGWSGEEGSVYQAVEEAIEIGRRSGVRVVQISHLAGNSPYSGDPELHNKVRDLIFAARDEGIDVLADILPSDWGSVAAWPARSVFSPAYFEDGREALLERLRDPEQRAALKQELLTKSPAEMGFENTTARILLIRAGLGDGVWLFPPVGGSFKNPEYERKTLDVIAEMKGVDLFDALFEMLVEENGEIHITNKVMDDRSDQMVWSNAMPSSDGGGTARPGESDRRVRPSGYSGFSDALIWVREKRLVTIEDMVRKMTSMAAHLLRLPDRGLIKEGFRADITVFDLDNVTSTCTYENDAMPGYPLGIPYVIVNGVPVIDNDQLTEALPGEVLRHSSA